MRDPARWIDEEGAPPELQRLLAKVPRARPIDAAAQARLRLRVARVAAIPVTAAAWLTLKSAAAFVAAGTATAATLVVAEVVLSDPAPAPVSAPSVSAPRVPRPARALVPKPEPPVEEAVQAPEDVASPPPHTTAQRHSADKTEGLSQESRLLERARLALLGNPNEALTLTQEHRRRFSRPYLAEERSLLEIEALHRLGRNAEARRRAELLLSDGADGLYAERIRLLLGKMGAR